MKIRRVTVQKRRAGRRRILPAFLFFLLFPCLMVLLKGGEPSYTEAVGYRTDAWVAVKHFWGEERVPLEEYLVGMMAATIPLEYEEEVLKAQSILLRSWCLSLSMVQNGYDIIPEEEVGRMYFGREDFQAAWPKDYETKYERIRQILEETEGMVLIQGGQIVAAPFFRVSNGNTRRIEEYQTQPEEWAYLRALACPEDVNAPEYLGRVELEEEEFKRKIEQLLKLEEGISDRIVLFRDSTDYVKTVEVADRTITGEEFRGAFGLASSCFTLQKQENRIVIKTRGMGHGFGFCQYHANLLAQQGQTCGQLLETFFKGLKVEKI